MSGKQELENLKTVALAVLCSKVAADPRNYTELGATTARELHKEWASLQSPPEMLLKDEQKKESQLAAWRTRAIEFLAGIL